MVPRCKGCGAGDVGDLRGCPLFLVREPFVRLSFFLARELPPPSPVEHLGIPPPRALCWLSGVSLVPIFLSSIAAPRADIIIDHPPLGT
jgi:hypothetical protein